MPLNNSDGKYECVIPWEVIARDTGFCIGVFGGDSLRSDLTFVAVSKGTQVDGELPQPPTPDWYDNIERITDEATSTATEVKKMADNGEFNGKPGRDGDDGKSAYELALENGYTGTEEEWLASLRGKDGKDGADGYTPVKGVDYFDGEKGEKGDPFRYDDFTLEQLAELKGADGQNGTDGYTPIKGVDYFTPEEIELFKNDVTPQKGVDYFDGEKGADGYTPQKGIDYFDGEDGYTPVKGTDYFTEAEIQDIVNRTASKLNVVKTVMDSVAVAGVQYYLGEQTAVDIVFPDDAQIGQMITVSWYNGTTPVNLSITGTMLAFDYTPSANTRSEINALWDGTYWAVIGNEMEVPNE